MFSLRSCLTIVCFGASLFVLTDLSHAQGESNHFRYDAGEVLDIILVSFQPEYDSTLQVYFKEALPVATRHGYSSGVGMKVARPMLLGNYQAEAMLFGSWPSLAARRQALDSLESGVPRFHQMRREIWSSFNLNYWELTEPLDFIIDNKNYNVVSAYWSENAAQLSEFCNKRKAAQVDEGGQPVLHLGAATSPFMYRYAPDALVITAWPDEASYRRALSKLTPLDSDLIDQVHEFVIL